MSLKPYYAQRCPCCKKTCSIEVELLGFEVNCPHCGQSYEARDQDQRSAAFEDPVTYWINFTSHQFDSTEPKNDAHLRRPK
jgi:uncharacterized protein (DUF983 family)